ncbi:hypothetical protein EBR37_00055 [bacterium]|nr:hypothetical protein [bacterium]
MILTKKNARHLTPLLRNLLGVFVIVAVFTVLELTNTTHFFHHQQIGSGIIPSRNPKTQTPPENQSGASCYITFKNNGVVKTLAPQNADNEGTVIWNWDISKAGFTEGTWKINVIASLNGTTKTANDSMNLEVGP